MLDPRCLGPASNRHRVVCVGGSICSHHAQSSTATKVAGALPARLIPRTHSVKNLGRVACPRTGAVSHYWRRAHSVLYIRSRTRQPAKQPAEPLGASESGRGYADDRHESSACACAQVVLQPSTYLVVNHTSLLREHGNPRVPLSKLLSNLCSTYNILAFVLHRRRI